MAGALHRTICWTPLWNTAAAGVGLEHLLLGEGAADSVVLAIDDEQGPFRLTYQLAWDDAWRLCRADLEVVAGETRRSLSLTMNGDGRWHDRDGRPRRDLDGCLDIDIWPTPFTNSFPIRRQPLAVGERREFRLAWVSAPSLTVEAKAQAYTRLAERRYLFESLDGSGFRVELPVDAEGIVLDYPGLFRRVIDAS